VPELVEVELSRRLAERLCTRTVASVDALDPHACAHLPDELAAALIGATFTAPRRRGKLLLLDTDRTTLGVHFGMTGRLVIDGDPALDRLLYASATFEPRWIRFALSLRDGGRVELHDPRRLARLFIDPDEAALGPDATSLTLDELRTVLRGRTRGIALKARLLDQSRLAGVGNLIADEVLWRAALSPERPAASLDDEELRRLHRQVKSTTTMLLRRGGSHTGDLMAARAPGGRCPKDGQPLARSTVGGRTTYWCPAHQN
jgi:formamidopyrimidine-DNA glycosylase